MKILSSLEISKHWSARTIPETKVNKKIYKRFDWVNKNAFPAIFLNEESKKKISSSKKGKSFSSEKPPLIAGRYNKKNFFSSVLYNFYKANLSPK